MSVIIAGKTFANGEQLTADKLNQVIDQATFNASEAVDGSTLTLISGAMAVNDNGITESKIANGAVTTDKITDSNVTKAKIENVANMKVLGNTSGSDAAPQEVDILDEDNMSSDSATSLATQQSIKAYIDEYALKEPTSGKTGTFDVTTSWQDLNLSTAVGANKAMVIMEVYGGSVATNLLFRTKESAIDRYDGDSYAGWSASGLVLATLDRGGVITIVTDSSGIIEYAANGATSGVSYNILAYQKLL